MADWYPKPYDEGRHKGLVRELRKRTHPCMVLNKDGKPIGAGIVILDKDGKTGHFSVQRTGKPYAGNGEVVDIPWRSWVEGP